MNRKSFFYGNTIALATLLSCILPTVTWSESPVAKGKLKFDGQVLNTTIIPNFWFREEKVKGQQVSARVEFKDGEFQIFGLPTGSYGTDVSVDLNQENQRGMPGDLSAWTVFSITPSVITEFDIDMTKLIHMTSPVDNGSLVMGSACEGKVTHGLPIKIAWDPIVEGAYYDYKVITAPCKPFKYGDSVASGTTQELSVTLNLPPSKVNEIYILTISARKQGKSVGSMETHGGNFRAWDYRFRVKERQPKGLSRNNFSVLR